MTFYVIEKGTGNTLVEISNATAVDLHIHNKFIVWTPDENNTLADYKIIKINPETQWVSINA